MRGGVEGVGLADVGPGGEIGVVQLGDQVRPGQAQQIVVALQRHGVIGEPLAAEIRLGQALALDHHPPGAVQDQDALAGGRLQVDPMAVVMASPRARPARGRSRRPGRRG